MTEYCIITNDDRVHAVTPERPLTIGRAPINRIVLNDRLVSRSHATVGLTMRGLLLTDKNSANGVQVNGQVVREAFLNHGDTIRIGKFVLSVHRGSRAEAEQWLQRRRADTHTDQTITDLNLNQARSTDMRGDLAMFGIIDLLQTLIEQRRQGGLALSCQGQQAGTIYLANGTICHAETATGQSGPEAFYELLGLEQGQFVMRTELRPPKLTIMESPKALLLEGCRRLDERRATAAP
jgi:pSer/pThr/pTyr-binding forkhead associated (FHA) protein